MNPQAIQDLLQTLAPELGRVPLHIVHSLEPALCEWGGCLGLAARGAPLLLNHAAIVAAAKSEEDACPNGPHDLARIIERWYAAVAIHEAGHVLDFGPPFFKAEENVFSVSTLAKWMTMKESVRTPSGLPAWYQHESSWLRINIHLHCRAERRCGLRLWPSDFMPHMLYGLAPGYTYWRALGDEPARMENETFEAIKATQPPSAFLELWQQDTVEALRAGRTITGSTV